MKISATVSQLTNLPARGAAVLGIVLLLAASRAHAVLTPQVVTSSDILYGTDAERVTGLLVTTAGGKVYVGSAVVVASPRVLLTCAHIALKSGQWVPAASMGFGPGCHSVGPPSALRKPRGYYKFSTYASEVAHHGGTSSGALNADLLAAFSYSVFATGPTGAGSGSCTNYWATGAATVLTNRNYWKKITGYPTSASGVRSNFYMHRVGPFVGSFVQRSGAFYTITGATTYGGNSGGPVFGYDPSGGGHWHLAGIQLTSNGTTMLGVRVIDANAVKMINAAKAMAGG